MATGQMMLIAFIEQGNLITKNSASKAGYNFNKPWCCQGTTADQAIVQAKASGLWRCPSDTGPTDIIYGLAAGTGALPCNYMWCHGVNDAAACFQEAGKTASPTCATFPSPTAIPAAEKGAFGVNVNVRIRDITDGTSSTFAMGEAATGAYNANPKWTICDGRFCTKSDTVPCGAAWLPGTGLIAGNPSPFGWGVNITTTSGCAVDAGCTHYSKIRGGWVIGCTMEPLNKNPVTGTYAVYGAPYAPSLTCMSSWTLSKLGAAGVSGPPCGCPPTVSQNAVCQWPPAYNAAQVSTMSNFHSDHPSGGLFLLCDGSVQYINENISMAVYTGLSTISGGETVQGNVGEP
jgi:hypothetical protein